MGVAYGLSVGSTDCLQVLFWTAVTWLLLLPNLGQYMRFCLKLSFLHLTLKCVKHISLLSLFVRAPLICSQSMSHPSSSVSSMHMPMVCFALLSMLLKIFTHFSQAAPDGSMSFWALLDIFVARYLVFSGPNRSRCVPEGGVKGFHRSFQSTAKCWTKI